MSFDLDCKRRRGLALSKHPSTQPRPHGTTTEANCATVALHILAETREDHVMLQYALRKLGRSRQTGIGWLGSYGDSSSSQAPSRRSRWIRSLEENANQNEDVMDRVGKARAWF